MVWMHYKLQHRGWRLIFGKNMMDLRIHFLNQGCKMKIFILQISKNLGKILYFTLNWVFYLEHFFLKYFLQTGYCFWNENYSHSALVSIRHLNVKLSINIVSQATEDISFTQILNYFSTSKQIKTYFHCWKRQIASCYIDIADLQLLIDIPTLF